MISMRDVFCSCHQDLPVAVTLINMESNNPTKRKKKPVDDEDAGKEYEITRKELMNLPTNKTVHMDCSITNIKPSPFCLNNPPKPFYFCQTVCYFS